MHHNTRHRALVGTAVTIGTVSIIAALATSPITWSATSVPSTTAPAAPAVRTVAAVRTQSVPMPPYPLRCTVTASNVNYRRGPGTQYASYGQLGHGFTFASDGGIPNPRSRYQYWDNIDRPGHADAYVDDAYVYCSLARSA